MHSHARAALACIKRNWHATVTVLRDPSDLLRVECGMCKGTETGSEEEVRLLLVALAPQ